MARSGSVTLGTIQGTTALSPAAACPLQVVTIISRSRMAKEHTYKDSRLRSDEPPGSFEI